MAAAKEVKTSRPLDDAAHAKFICDVCDVTITGKVNYDTHIAGKRHLSLLKGHERNESGIFVSGFQHDMPKEVIESYFKQYGPFHKLIFSYPKKYAIIFYEKKESAYEALKTPNVVLRGQQISVMKRKNRIIVNYKKSQEKPDPPPVTLMSNASFDSQLTCFMEEVTLEENIKNEKISQLCSDLYNVFSSRFIGCRICPFGSSVTGLTMKNSDVDILLDTERDGPQRYSISDQEHLVRLARGLLQKHESFTEVIGIPSAKIALVKFLHKPTQCRCDLSFKNPLGVSNSYLIRFLISLDPRIKPLLLVIKYWGQRINLVGIGKFSNYAVVMLFLFYLQQLEVPIIPPIALLQAKCRYKKYVDDWECSYTTDRNALNWKPERNTMSSTQLLYGFFMFCVETDFTFKVLCPLLGCMLDKSLFFPENIRKLPNEMNVYKNKLYDPKFRPMRTNCAICIQDPFDHSHCLSSIVPSKMLHLFRNHCSVAAELCKEKLLMHNNYGGEFLNALFNDTEKIVMKSITSLRTLSIFPTNITTLESFIDNKVEITENILRDTWYQLVFDAILHIFENNFKLELTVTHTPKVQKTSNQCSVSESSAVQCIGYQDMWSTRKKSEAPSKHPKEGEEEETLPGHSSNETPKLLPCVNFICVVHNRKNPTEVILDIGATADTSVNVCAFILHLKNNLQQLVEHTIERLETLKYSGKKAN